MREGRLQPAQRGLRALEDCSFCNSAARRALQKLQRFSSIPWICAWFGVARALLSPGAWMLTNSRPEPGSLRSTSWICR